MSWQSVLAIADKLEPKLRREFIAAMTKLSGVVDVERIAAAVLRGQTVNPDMLADLSSLSADLQGALDTMAVAFEEAGRVTAGQIATRVGTNLRFDLTNPFAVSSARTMAAQLVTHVSGQVRDAIRVATERAFTETMTRREMSASIRSVIGLTPQQARAVMRYRQELIDMGLRSDLVAKRSSEYAARKLRERARVIARTEIMGASNRGAQAAWVDATDKGLLDPRTERKWTVTPDDRLCDACRAMAGQRRGLREPFISPTTGRTVMNAPLHPNCRCVAVIVVVKPGAVAALNRRRR